MLVRGYLFRILQDLKTHIIFVEDCPGIARAVDNNFAAEIHQLSTKFLFTSLRLHSWVI